jgi:glycosyltransferase involved in cell wall biosynthesis
MSEKPKLLIVTTIPNTIRAFLIPYACYFRGLGWQVDAMARDITKFEELFVHFDRLTDANWSRNPLNRNNLFEAVASVRRAIEEEGYDIVHVHTPVAAFVTRYALRKIKLSGKPKVVYTAHGFHFCKGGGRTANLLYRALEKMAGRWTDKLIVINHEDFDAAKKYGIVPIENLAYMPGIGLDFSKYDPGAVSKADIQQIRDQLGLKSDETLFTLVAEFIPRKRHRDVVEAMSKLNNHKIHVAFAGTGPLSDNIKRLSDNLKVHHWIHFLGNIKDIRPLIAASRAVILPSAREGLARSLMEAACLGVPLIGSNARGVRGVVQPNRGLIYPTGDIFALRDAIQQMYEEPYPPVKPDPAWRIENLIRMHEELYMEVINKTPAKPDKDGQT